MKKLFTLLFLTAAFVSFKGTAQIVACQNLVVNFTFQAETPNTNVIHFTNTTQGYTVGDTIQWTFGDGSSSAEMNPVHAYTSGGVKQVCLIIRKVVSPGAAPCINYHCTQITIVMPNTACSLTASFISQPSTSNPLGVYFTNTSTGFASGDSIRWSFGDGTYAYTPTAYHAYANAGTYQVCLWVKKNNSPTAPPCVSEICHSVTVYAPCTLNASFTTTQTPQPNIILFTNTSTGYVAGDSIHWTFGDGTSSSDPNPTHTYTTGNTYTVCLTVMKHTPAGVVPCSSTICHTIAVTVPPTCNLHALFTFQTGANQVVYFTNTSTGFATGDSIRWSFGDGSVSYELNPIHTYANPGVYNVCLWVKKNNISNATPCVSEICHTVIVSAPCNLVVSYSATAAAGSPNVIQFTNTSTGYAVGDTISWSFGDGSSSTTPNPLHTYATAGTYQVCLIIRKAVAPGTAPCVNYHCGSVTVALLCNLQASFSSQTNGPNPVVYFVNTSTGFATGDSIRWSFGDGTVSYDLNPVHTYASPGVYNVCLWVKKNSTSPNTIPCVSEICHTVTVTAPCSLVVSFTSLAETAQGNVIHFTNTSTGYAAGDSIHWTFGDGTSSSDPNPVHTYTTGGTYQVCLTIVKHTASGTAPCIGTICHSITVANPQVSCSQLANFHFTTISSTGLGAVFTPDHVYTDVTYTWTFGDGTGSHDIPATHQFATTGYYTVCLTAYRNNSCASTSCIIVHLPSGSTPNCNDITLGFVTTTSTLSLNSVTFTGSSNAPILDQVWTITRVPTPVVNGTVTIHAINPTYAFADTGNYNVCLHATFANGCTRDYCRLVHVSFPVPGTNACSLQLYPNPATSTINAMVTLTQASVINTVVYNSGNMQVLQKQQQGVVGINTVNLNIANLPAGIYTMRVNYGNQFCYATFIKQ